MNSIDHIIDSNHMSAHLWWKKVEDGNSVLTDSTGKTIHTLAKGERVYQVAAKLEKTLYGGDGSSSPDCYYCGLPTYHGECSECGSVPSLLTRENI